MPELLPADVRTCLLRHSRQTLEAVTAPSPSPAPPSGDWYDQPAAAFVTLRKDHELRGCIGDISFEVALGTVVGDATRAAATSDPRFPPVTRVEIVDISIEISRLTPLAAAEPGDIVPGRHGIVIRKGTRSGLLLPQVAEEFDCDAVGFLELGYRKAGIRFRGRHDPAVSLQIFEAEVFEE